MKLFLFKISLKENIRICQLIWKSSGKLRRNFHPHHWAFFPSSWVALILFSAILTSRQPLVGSSISKKFPDESFTSFSAISISLSLTLASAKTFSVTAFGGKMFSEKVVRKCDAKEKTYTTPQRLFSALRNWERLKIFASLATFFSCSSCSLAT